MNELDFKELLVVHNEKAGQKRARGIAEAAGVQLDTFVVSLNDFLAHSEEYLALAPQVVVALGGDGTHFSVLNTLQLSGSTASLLPLGFGGENVLSKSVGLKKVTTEKDVNSAMLRSLFGMLESIPTQANTVTFSEDQTRNSNWMVNAGGVVVPVLTEVEELRIAGASTRMQRYGGVLKYLWKRIPSQPTIATLEDGTQIVAYEVAVVNDFLPNITGKYSFIHPTQRYQGNNYLVTVGEHKLGLPKTSIVLGVMLDVCAHAVFGLESITNTLKVRPIGKQIVTLAHQGSQIAIDSELYSEPQGIVSIKPSTQTAMTQVFTGIPAQRKSYEETLATAP